MQTEAELTQNRIRVEIETAKRLVLRGLPAAEAIQRECKCDFSRLLATLNCHTWPGPKYQEGLS